MNNFFDLFWSYHHDLLCPNNLYGIPNMPCDNNVYDKFINTKNHFIKKKKQKENNNPKEATSREAPHWQCTRPIKQQWSETLQVSFPEINANSDSLSDIKNLALSVREETQNFQSRENKYPRHSFIVPIHHAYIRPSTSETTLISTARFSTPRLRASPLHLPAYIKKQICSFLFLFFFFGF